MTDDEDMKEEGTEVVSLSTAPSLPSVLTPTGTGIMAHFQMVLATSLYRRAETHARQRAYTEGAVTEFIDAYTYRERTQARLADLDNIIAHDQTMREFNRAHDIAMARNSQLLDMKDLEGFERDLGVKSREFPGMPKIESYEQLTEAYITTTKEITDSLARLAQTPDITPEEVTRVGVSMRAELDACFRASLEKLHTQLAVLDAPAQDPSKAYVDLVVKQKKEKNEKLAYAREQGLTDDELEEMGRKINAHHEAAMRRLTGDDAPPDDDVTKY